MLTCAACGRDSPEATQFCGYCAAMLSAPAGGERRKTVTVLFCDLAGSTAMGETVDPELLRALLARYFEVMQAIVERHGGSVEKFIGDAVMAVFGVPVVHEDDALRAALAAVEMRDALQVLGLAGRIGVMTGEVVAGTVERLVTGDAVNVAARLQAAAPTGQILLGLPTLELLREAVEVEPLEPLRMKGKAQPVVAYRLLRVLEAPERRSEAPFVGRRREVALIAEAWERTRAGQRCEVVTVVGEAGVGKSRLVVEAVASLAATVVRGRCLPYGHGLTYGPVVDVLNQLDLIPANEVAAVAIRSLLGEPEAATSAEEIAWAFRKTLEQAAAERPLVLVFDDIQWGEETFLDLIEHVALLSSGAPILLLCMARPELDEHRPAWPVTLRLEPLGEEAVDQLIPERLPGELRARIARAAGGNPLFVREIVAMAGEAESDVFVPPTLRALLAARLDQLETAERSVLERGSIEGEIFHRGAVQALSPDEDQVTPRLAALVRKRLIRPERSLLADDDGFRFGHLLLRDAAYEALPKAVRAGLHERYAAWLQQHGVGLVELDELLGYHLEQACVYHAELGGPDDRLAEAARGRLTAAGGRAHRRADYGAAVSLLERAAALLSPTEIDVALEMDLGEALLWGGRIDDALRRAESLAERSAAVGNRVGELCGRIFAGMARSYVEPEGAYEALTVVVEQALPVFQAADDDLALYVAYHARGWAAFQHAQIDAALEAFERAAAHARRAGQPHELLGWRAIFRFYGTTPVSDLLAWLDESEPTAGSDHWLAASRAGALAMVGRFDEARAILAETRANLADRGGGIEVAVLTGIESVGVELLAGHPAAAVEFGTEGCRLLEEQGEQTFLSTAAGTLARALYAIDQVDNAEAWAGRAAELGASDDAFTQMIWRQVRAKVLARRGEHGEAERLAREAVTIGEATDLLDGQGDAYADLAEVLLLVGQPDAAAAALEQALERYKDKGNNVSAHHTQGRLTGLQDTAPR